MSYGSGNGGSSSGGGSTSGDGSSGGGGSSYSGNSYGTSKVTDYDKWGLGLSNVQTNTVNASNRYVGGFSNVPVGSSNLGSLGFSRGGFSTTVVTDISNHNIYTSNITSDGLYYDISDIGVSNNTGYWDGNTTQFKYYDTSFNKMTRISIGDGLGGDTTANYYNYNIWGRMITNFTGKVYFRIICDDKGAIYISDTSFNAPSNGSTGDPDLNLHEGIECPTWSPANSNAGNTGTYDVVANKQYFIRILWGENTGKDYLYMWAESDSNRVYFPNQSNISNTLANYPVTNLTNGNVLFFSGEPLMSYYAPPGNYFPGETIPICARWYDKVSITTDPSLILHGISHTYKLEAGAGGRNGDGSTGQGVASADGNFNNSTVFPPRAFNGTLGVHSAWVGNNNQTTNQSLNFTFPTHKYITRYKIWPRAGNVAFAPKSWELRACDLSDNYDKNISSTYTIIDTRSNQTSWPPADSGGDGSDFPLYDASCNEYYVANPGYYRHYVLFCKEQVNSSFSGNNHFGISELAYYSSPVKESVASLDVNNSGNGTNTLHFNYTVGEGENAVDLKVLGISGDISGSDGLPVGNGSGILSNVKILSNTSNVDTSASLLYAKTTAGTYKIGDTICIETGWSEPVNKNGTPDLSLNLSNGGVATYLNGSGTNILKFNYTVQRGQNTTDLQIVNISGDIRDQSGGAALTLDTPGTKLLAGGLTGLRGTGGAQGDASASTWVSPNYLSTRAFNGTISNWEEAFAWLTLNNSPFPQWLAFTFPTEKYITKYKIWARNYDYNNAHTPKDWQLLGSSVANISDFSYNVLSTYTIIDTQSNQTNWPGTTLTSIQDDSSYNEYYVANPGYYKHYVLHISDGNYSLSVAIGELAYYGDDYPNNILMPNVNILTDISSINPGTEVQLVSVSAPDNQYKEGDKIPITATWIKDISYSGDVSLNLSNGMIIDISGYGLDYHKNSLVFNYIVGSNSNEPTPNLSVLSYSGNIYDPSLDDISAAQVTGDLGSAKYGVIIRKPNDKTNFVHKASYTTNQLASLSANDASYGINEEKRPNNVKIDNSYAFVGDHLYDRGTGRILVYELSYNPVNKADNDIVYHKIGVKSLSGGNKFVIDNDISNIPYFYAGQRYRFDQSDSTNSSHRILFGYDSTLADPQYDINYGTPGQLGAYTEFTPKKDGQAFYISCQTHGIGMGSLYNGYYGIKILTREFWNFHSAIYGDSEGAYLGKNIDIDMANNRIIASNGKGSQDLEYLAAGAGALNGTGGLQGDASASTWYNDSFLPIEAFNGTIFNNGDCWHSKLGNFSSGVAQWLSFEFPTEKCIAKYKIWSRNAFDNLKPNSWELLGIHDSQINSISDFSYNIDSSYTIIDTRSDKTDWVRPYDGNADITNDTKRNEYYVANPGYYKYYVLHITSSSDSNYVAIGQLAYYANDYPYGGANIYKLNANDTWSIDASNLIGDLSNNNPNMGLYPYGQLGYNGDVAIDSSYAIISTKRGEERLAAGAGALDGSGELQGDASASTWLNDSYLPIDAFNGTIVDNNDCWHSKLGNFSSGVAQWLSFEFPTEKYITKYKIWPRLNNNNLQPYSWELLGIRDGVINSIIDFSYNIDSSYTIIDTRSGQTSWSDPTINSITNDTERNEYYVANPGYYKYYVLHIRDGQSSSYVVISELAYYETVFPQGIAYTYELSANGDWLLNGNGSLSDISGPRGGFGASIDVDAKTKRLAIGSTTRNEILFAGAGALDGSNNGQGVATAHGKYDANYDAPEAFDGTITSVSDSWVGQNSTPSGMSGISNQELRFLFPTEKYITKYIIWPRMNNGQWETPTEWQLRGVSSGTTYNPSDSSTYTIISQESNQSWSGFVTVSTPSTDDITNKTRCNEYLVNNPGSYIQYILHVTDVISSGSKPAIGQLAYYGYENDGKDAVYTYDYSGVNVGGVDMSGWVFDQSFNNGDVSTNLGSGFGSSVVLDASTLIVTAPYLSDYDPCYVKTNNEKGAVYVFELSGVSGNWEIDQSFNGDDMSYSHFGYGGVALDGSFLLTSYSNKSFGGIENTYVDPDDGHTYRSHTFLSTGTFTVPYNIEVDFLIVAGGGGGGRGQTPGNVTTNKGGGGGAGGLIYNTNQILSYGQYNVTVGAGGLGGPDIKSSVSTHEDYANGKDSGFNGYIAKGGGYGGVMINSTLDAGDGGSGGGARAKSVNPGGNWPGGDASGGTGVTTLIKNSTTPNEVGVFGNDGGGTEGDNTKGGGGGGAGQVGSSGWAASGEGGDGKQYSIRNGTLVYYAGGGGGGEVGSAGGAGGGGAGSSEEHAQVSTGRGAKHGTDNTGGGGGGAYGGWQKFGGNGGSGIVVIRYKIQTSAYIYERLSNSNGDTSFNFDLSFNSPIDTNSSNFGNSLALKGNNAIFSDGQNTVFYKNYIFGIIPDYVDASAAYDPIPGRTLPGTTDPSYIYYIGDVLDIYMRWTNPVFVRGLGSEDEFGTYEKAYLNLSNDASALYYSGSGTNTLIFRYNVGQDDLSSTDLSINNYDVSLILGGSIESSKGDAAEQPYSDDGNWGKFTNRVLIDTEAVALVDIEYVPNTYLAGEYFDISLTFSKNVYTSGADSSLILSGDISAAYLDGSGTETITYRYYVPITYAFNDPSYNKTSIDISHQIDVSLITLASGLNSAISSLIDMSANGAPISFLQQNLTGLNIDPIRPGFREFNTSSSTTDASNLSSESGVIYRIGDVIDISGTWTEELSCVVTPNYGVNNRDVSPGSAYLNLSNDASAIAVSRDISTILFKYIVTDGCGNDWKSNDDPSGIKAINYGGIITDIYGNPARGRDIDSSLAFLNITTVKTGSPYLNLEVVDDASGIFVDNSLPTFVDISYQPLTNTAPDPSYVYGIGDTIDIDISFNEPVWGQHSLFTRDASLCLSNDASAEIFAGSGTTILKFRYTVQEGDTDVCLNSLDLSIIAIDGSICDIARHDFSYINESGYIYPLDNSSVLKNVRVKGTRTMDFLDISYNPNRDTSYNYYKVDDNIDISLVFNEQVWSYDAKLLLSNDSSAICIDGSGTNVLKFRYTVSNGGKDMSLNDLSIVAIDGSICDIGKNDLSYIYQVPDDNGVSIQLLMDASSDLSGVRVDSNIPTISDVSYVSQSTIPKYYGIGDNIDISLTFSENIWGDKVNHGVVSDASLLLSNDASAQLIAGSGTNILTFRYIIQAGDKDSSAIDLSIIAYDGCLCDVGGNELVKTNTFNVENIHKIGDKIRLDANYPQLTDISYHETGVAPDSGFQGPTNYTVYGIGNHLDISLTFNEHVYSHDASLTLTDTNQDFSARCIDGSGTNTLTFRYVVKQGDGNTDTREPGGGDNTWDGLTSTNDISIIGIDGSICDVGLNNMIDGLPNDVSSGGSFLDPSNIANKNIYIVGDRLAIVSYDFSTGSYGKNSSPQSNGQNGDGNGYIDISVNFSENVFVTRNNNTDISLCLSNDASATYISGSGEKALQFRYHLKDDTSHNDTDNLQVYNIDFNINDASVNNTNDVDGSQVLLWTYKHNSKLPGIVIDHTPPTIVDICYNPGTYNAGGFQNSSVDISINFSENVWSTDAKLLLSTGVSAECIDGSGTNILKFRYTVGKEKDGDNFIEQYTGEDISIVDFTGKIRDLAQNDFSKNSDFNGGIQANAFAFTGSGELTGVVIIPEAIAVTALIQSSSPVNSDGSNNYYGIDDILKIKLIFNKDIYYTSTIPGLNYPDPSLILSNDASATLIGYGDTSSILLFQYTINEGDKSENDLRIKGYDGSINSKEEDLSKGGFEHLGNTLGWSNLTFVNSLDTSNLIQKIIIDTSYLSLNRIDCSASTYKIGDFMDISFIFTEPVKVKTYIDTINGGTYPKLILNIKNTASDLSCVANYHSGHNTSGVKFRYFPAYYDQNSPDDNFNLQIDDISYGPNFDASIVDFANNPIRYPPLFRYRTQPTDLSLIGIITNTDFPKFLGIDVSAGTHLGTYKPGENVYITTTWDRPIDICKNIADIGELKLEFSNYLTSYTSEINAEREKATFFARGKWLGGNKYPTDNPPDSAIQDSSYSLVFKYTIPPFVSTIPIATNAGMKTYYRNEDDVDIKIRQFIPYEAIYDVSFNAHSAEQILIDCNAGFPIYKPNEQDIAETSTSQPGRPALRNVPRWDRFGNLRCANIAFNNVKGATSSSNSAKKTASTRITLGKRGK